MKKIQDSDKESWDSDAFYALADMRLVASIELLVFGHYLVVVLPLAVADVVVGQQFIGQVVVIDDLNHDTAEDYGDTEPLHLS